MSRKQPIIIYGPVFDYSGYALHTREILKAFIRDERFSAFLNPTQPDKLHAFNGLYRYIPDKLPKAPYFACTPPANVSTHGEKKFIMTTFESFDTHYGQYNRLTKFDHIFVPCTMNKKALIKDGISRRNVTVIPEGAEPKKHYRTDHKKFDKFTFLYLGNWDDRKNPKDIIKAYTTSNIKHLHTQLMLVTRNRAAKDGKGRQEIHNYILQQCLKTDTRFEKIVLNTDFLSDQKLNQIYNKSHVFTRASKGEAWDLPLFEASMIGLPAIATKKGGHREWFNPPKELLIEGHKGEDYALNTSDCEFYHGCQFYLPHYESIRKTMEEVVDNYEDYKKWAEKNSKKLEKKYTWKKSLKKLTNKVYKEL